MTFEGEAWTYAQMLERIDATTARLSHIGGKVLKFASRKQFNAVVELV